mgnify:CR=1 FL=1
MISGTEDVGRQSDAVPFHHDPVMLQEILDCFGSIPAGVVVDATVGGAGHSVAILERRADLDIVGLDHDDVALEAAGKSLEAYGERARLYRTRFDGLSAALDALEIEEIVGVLFDLGVSSPQFDVPDRGFSYRHDGPLDMRMDTTASLTAAELVNHADFGSLSKILHRYADERFARRITNAIIAARPIAGTQELAEIVKMAIPAAARRTGGHPAKRTFQALRIAVNAELDVLAPALEQAIDRLAPGGRGAVLSYHSGEDRIVKQVLREAENATRTPRHLPVDVPSVGTIKLLKRAGTTASEEEQARNPRSASARLRLFEKLPVAA